MPTDIRVCPVDELPPGKIVGVEGYAVGNNNGTYFAVTRHCRHLRADLAGGRLDEDGCLVCPWHGSKYDTTTGQMVRGPQSGFEKVPGLGFANKLLTKALPLGRKKVVVKKGVIYIR